MNAISPSILLSDFIDQHKLKMNDPTLFGQAFTHRSFPNSNHNERLEFLGDAIVKLIMTEYLFQKYPQKNEGELSKLMAIYVQDRVLADLARHLNISELLRIGENEKIRKVNQQSSILSDAMEALFAAIYLDQGYGVCRDFLLRIYKEFIFHESYVHELLDHKTALQELTQSIDLGIPRYRVIQESGPDHDKKYTVEVFIHHATGTITGDGTGKTKKQAQQEAAKMAITKLEKILNEFA